MIQKKAKALFAEVSHYQVRLARTDKNTSPLTVEDVVSIPVGATSETRRAIDDFAGTPKGTFARANCAVYPQARFLHKHLAENPAKTRQKGYPETILESEVSVNPAEVAFKTLYPATGKNYDPTDTLSRETLYVGASHESLKEEQRRLVELGIYPNRLEIASVCLFAGTKRAVLEEDMDGSALVLEIGENQCYGYVVNLSGLALSLPLDFGISSISSSLEAELGLHDSLSARKVLFSKTFDFRDMGSKLLEDLISQVNASTGQFEIKTGKSVRSLFLPGIPSSLAWIGEVLAEELGMENWHPPLKEWLEQAGITLSPKVKERENLQDFLPLFCQMAQLESPTQ